MVHSQLLQAFEGKNKTTPVWFMRQAGRFLPEYRAIREKYSLEEMFNNPQLAAEITCLPIKKLGVDAAILFADILTLPSHLGFKIEFTNSYGPVIHNPIEDPREKNLIRDFDDIPSIRAAIKETVKQLPASIPLLGFAGAPFTVLCYLVEGESSVNFSKTLKLAYGQPVDYHRLMTRLTESTIRYIKLQQESGIKAFQLFDTWAGLLPASDYERLVLPYVRKIYLDIKLPSIYYVKNCRHLLNYMEFSMANFLSVCNTADFASDEFFKKTKCGIQGNLSNATFYADKQTLKQETLRILKAAKKFEKYIFNLSHGLFPDTDVEKVKYVVELVHEFNHRPSGG